jgi:hypothetical protein
MPGPCGIGWWSNNDGHCACLPKDAYWGSGAGHQTLLVVPSLNLIAVRNGRDLASLTTPIVPIEYASPTFKWLFEPLMHAITNGAPTKNIAPSFPNPFPSLSSLRRPPRREGSASARAGAPARRPADGKGSNQNGT